MKIIHENGKSTRLNAVVETYNGIPLRVFVNHQVRNVYKIKGRYWFRYQNQRCYFKIQTLDKTNYSYVKVHLTQCYKCCRMKFGSYCISPEGWVRYFNRYTQEKCPLFKGKSKPEVTV